jgi:hypothetical protein
MMASDIVISSKVFLTDSLITVRPNACSQEESVCRDLNQQFPAILSGLEQACTKKIGPNLLELSF